MLKKILVLVFGIALWFIPAPEGISPEAWHLFAIFITTIFSVVFGVLGILVASMLGLCSRYFHANTLAPSCLFGVLQRHCFAHRHGIFNCQSRGKIWSWQSHCAAHDCAIWQNHFRFGLQHDCNRHAHRASFSEQHRALGFAFSDCVFCGHCQRL